MHPDFSTHRKLIESYYKNKLLKNLSHLFLFVQLITTTTTTSTTTATV